MSRDDGFTVADISVHLFDDDKVKRLYRELGGDLGRMGHAMMLREATLLASWRDGCRRTVEEAAPLWLAVDEAIVETLVRVRLLDRSHRIPTKSWSAWFDPAWDRRETRRRSGALGGLRQRGKRSHSDAIAELERRSSDATPVRPTGRTVRHTDRPSSPRADARETAPSNNGARRDGRPVRLAELLTPEAVAAVGKTSA